MSIWLLPHPAGFEPRTLTVSEYDMQLMRRDVESHKPEEACGMLIGRINGFDAITIHTIPVTNTLHSPTRFRMDGREQVDVFNQMENEDLDLVGIYHSHPQGPPGPSEIDVREAYYPNVVHLIWSRTGGIWNCAGYSINGGQVLMAVLKFNTHG
ncbi:MAG: hypothetical protein A2Z16_03555 [Chloroflexi bacterium RBG_16_54_18]|nr:MAG: hypothetical protein A2Z16_03555 [Chloroflexi bacterium RBG_16_54_18]